MSTPSKTATVSSTPTDSAPPEARPTKPWLRKLRSRPEAFAPAAPKTPKAQPALIRPGNKNDAERWRGLFLGALQREEAPGKLRAWLSSGVDGSMWTMLYRKDGAKFRSFDQFCCEPEPWGLGREPGQVHKFLEDLLGGNAAALATVAPAMRGVPRDPKSRTRQAGGFSERKEERLRAVQERAPEVVRQLYALEVVSLEQAARFGKMKPTPAQVEETARVVGRLEPILAGLGDKPKPTDIEHAQHQVGTLLPSASRRDPIRGPLRSFARLSRSDQQRFLDVARDQFDREGVVAAE